MEKLVELGILFDFYGKLLTERQYSIIELFYLHDLSLTEIGDDLNITKQGVYDTLKRAESKLYEFENNLGLVRKFYSSHNGIKEILNISRDIMGIAKDNKDDSIQRKTLEIIRIGKEILDNSREVIE